VDGLPAEPALAGASFAVGLEELAPPQPNRVKHAAALTQPTSGRRNSELCIQTGYSDGRESAHRDFSWIPIKDANQSRSSCARLGENAQKTPHLIGAGDSIASAGRQSAGAQAERVLGQHGKQVLVGTVITSGSNAHVVLQ